MAVPIELWEIGCDSRYFINVELMGHDIFKN